MPGVNEYASSTSACKTNHVLAKPGVKEFARATSMCKANHVVTNEVKKGLGGEERWGEGGAIAQGQRSHLRTYLSS